MFEKSLVDLIRGLRGHKGQESEYIQSALKECRSEIRSQDMDVKATALLKLVYMEMFGHDMTWAAFNVLEVMASSKQMQKRVGYLAAVQTFRPETEVLMLAENLLKKDLTSPSIPTLSLPLITIPHIVTSSLALSLLTELLPRLSHSQPAVRKKTVVSLYRLALVYPETLRVAWPKIKERLLDEKESSSVTHAAVNVVCELGWRRPQDFLSLAPRLFELLTSDKNNWMSIKIIKLFAVLTPVEPRLVKKLVRPLTKILRETSAMSLLYECISGIIQGGILDGAEAGVDVDEVADLCISKLRGMIVLEGDPNLKYVALLAFNKIVGSHPRLISEQQDVIMACLDDPDISIKMQALELVSGMVDVDNLQKVVNRLMKQLANAPLVSANGADHTAMEEGDNTDLEQRLIPDKRGSEAAPLPDEYRHEIVWRILDMCSVNTYANITDFEWYIEILVHLVRHLPSDAADSSTSDRSLRPSEKPGLGSRIGTQLLDISVRVKELRPDATQAAEKLVLISNRSIVFATHAGGQAEVLKSAALICGEFTSSLASPYEVLNSLVHDSVQTLPASTLSIYIQAIPKVLSQVVAIFNQEWNTSRSTTLSLLLARTIDFLDKLSLHPNLEVQERAVEFLELLKIASEALSSQLSDATSAPLLLTSIIPSLFDNQDLNPVAPGAQSKVPIPTDLDLDSPINPMLNDILAQSQLEDPSTGADVYDAFYHERLPDTIAPTVLQAASRPAAPYDRASSPEPSSYQTPDSPATLARRKAERLARSRDDPFYIPPVSSSGRGTPIGNILRQSNGGPDDLDLDSIPIIDLQIDSAAAPHSEPDAGSTRKEKAIKPKKKAARKFAIQADETLDPSPDSQPQSQSRSPSRSATPTQSTAASAATSTPLYRPQPQRPGRNLLSISSNDLGSFSLSDGTGVTAADLLRQEEEEKEMAAALKLIEQKRLEMQRAEERRGVSYAAGVDEEGGSVVKRKKKRKDGKEGKVKKTKKKGKDFDDGDDDGGELDEEREAGEGESVVRKKKKAKRKVGAAKEEVVDEKAPEVVEGTEDRRTLQQAEEDAKAFDIS